MKILTSLFVLLFMITQTIFDFTDGQMIRSSRINQGFETESFRTVLAKVQVLNDEDLLSTFNDSFNSFRSLELSHFVQKKEDEKIFSLLISKLIKMHSHDTTDGDANDTIELESSGKSTFPYFENQLSKIGVIRKISSLKF